MRIHVFLLLFALLSGTSTSLYAQNDSVFITGKIYDYENQEALKNAIFIHNNEIVKLNEDGVFNRYIKEGDTLSFRYTGHENYTIIVDQDLEKLSYISGIFLNQQEIEHSEFIIKPRLHNAKAFATYDPLQMEQMMSNAKHTLNVASYQANQAHEWDAQDNQKHLMTKKELEIEYKCAVAPSQQVGLSSTANLYDPIASLQIRKDINSKIPKEKQLSTEEEFYLKTLFTYREE